MTTKLFFFPYAGATKYSYRGFLKAIPENIEPVLIELPNRGTRLHLKGLDNIEAIMEFLFEELKSHLHGQYIIYGHSMGGLLTYLFVKHLIDKLYDLPYAIIISSCMPPSIIEGRTETIHDKDTRIFWNKIASFGGITNDIYENTELRALIEPALRSDFRAVENYRYEPVKTPFINIPLLLLYGDKESIVFKDLVEWKKEFSGPIQIESMPGDHFFFLGNEKEVSSKLLAFCNNYRNA
jgi:surfactin synthase thioesterase subunit